MSLFLRGALRQHPPSTPRAPAWDLPLLPDALSSPPFEPLAQVEPKWLPMKAAFLLSIASGKQVGELHVLSISDTCPRWDSQVLPFGQMWHSSPRCFHKPTSISLPSWHALTFGRTARRSCCALWVPKGRISRLLPVYGSRSNSCFCHSGTKGGVPSTSGCPTGLSIPSHMPTGPVAAPCHQG